MNIGCLGWGSLIWKPDGLPIRNGWFPDGPLLPIEFARRSTGNRVTLVLVPTVPPARVFWCLLSVMDLPGTIDALAARECVPKSKDRNIGFWSRTSGTRGTCADVIGEWAAAKQLDAVVWASLGPKWGNEEGRIPSATEVVDFLRHQGEKSEAAEYVRRAPEQIDTDYRRRMIEAIDWLKPGAG